MGKTSFENRKSPKKILYREKDLSLLSQLFLPVMQYPMSLSRRIVITGSTGSGKTTLIKAFEQAMNHEIHQKGLPLRFMYINCRREKTAYNMLMRMLHAVHPDSTFPKRGFSIPELMDIMFEVLQEKGLHTIIALDELEHLIEGDREILSSFIHFQDDPCEKNPRISFIGITTDIMGLNEVNIGISSCLNVSIIKLSPYSLEEIYEILSSHMQIQARFRKPILSNELLHKVAAVVYEEGTNIRYGLDILQNAWKLAEGEGEGEGISFTARDTLERAMKTILPYDIRKYVYLFKKSKLILLLAILRSIKLSKEHTTNLSKVKTHYETLCTQNGEQKKSYSQLWNYLNEFKKRSIIIIHIQSKYVRGRRALVTIPFPLAMIDKLETEVHLRILTNIRNNREGNRANNDE